MTEKLEYSAADMASAAAGGWRDGQRAAAEAAQSAPATAAPGNNLREVLAMVLQALDRDAAEGRAVRGEMAAELRAALAASTGQEVEP